MVSVQRAHGDTNRLWPLPGKAGGEGLRGTARGPSQPEQDQPAVTRRAQGDTPAQAGGNAIPAHSRTRQPSWPGRAPCRPPGPSHVGKVDGCIVFKILRSTQKQKSSYLSTTIWLPWFHAYLCAEIPKDHTTIYEHVLNANLQVKLKSPLTTAFHLTPASPPRRRRRLRVRLCLSKPHLVLL